MVVRVQRVHRKRDRTTHRSREVKVTKGSEDKIHCIPSEFCPPQKMNTIDGSKLQSGENRYGSSGVYQKLSVRQDISKEKERGATKFFRNGSWNKSWYQIGNRAGRLDMIFPLPDY